MRTACHYATAFLAIATIGLDLSTACARPDREPAAAPAPPVGVRVVPATMVERAEQIEAGGLVAAAETATVSSRVLAPVIAITVQAGDRVRAGDVLVRLDARDLAARAQQAGATTRAAEEALTAARSAQAAAAADHKLAAASHGRISQLRERNAATAQELDEADARLAAATAQAAAAQANVEQATAQLAAVRAAANVADITESYAVLRAPFDGEITERLIDPGNLATPGQPLLRLDAGGRRRVDVRVDEARAALVRPGDRVAVLLDAPTAADGNAGLDGTVIEVARAIAADQRAFTVKVALPAGTSPRTGTFARVRFDGARQSVLVVPASAVRVQGQVTSVFVVSGGRAHNRLVQVGNTDRDGVEILAGLDAGEPVVTAPPADLVDGRLVVVTASSGAAP
jgi:RND family efflux transporter MFP subunit